MMIKNSGKIELTNIEMIEYCLLDLENGEKRFYKDYKKINGFTGLYYRNLDLFFAIFPSENGPIVYYDSNLYAINRNLKIKWAEKNNIGYFKIKDYNINIKYNLSRYLDFDSWSTLNDIDLFYIIANNYKNDSFYDLYTIK